MQHVRVTHDYAAPVERVWACYTDHVGWSRWTGFGPVRLVREGTPDRDGVGCVRELGPGPFAVHEEVVAFEPPRRMVYRLIRGAVPIRDHEGEVTFEPLATGGTRVTWQCRFTSIVPGLGPLVRAGVGRLFAQILHRMTRQVS